MRLNLRTDYGLRVLMYLLARPGERAQVETMAHGFAISSNHLTKVVQRLSHGGFVETHRGRAGGVVLAKEPDDINLGDVVRLLEADFTLVECLMPQGNQCCLTPSCRLRGIVGEALDSFTDTFSRYTLADLDMPQLRQLTTRTPTGGRQRGGTPKQDAKTV